MQGDFKKSFLENLARRFGAVRKLGDSQSLYEIGGGSARIYIRYSKLHDGQKTFYGLRDADLRLLEGLPSVICFLWEGQPAPLLIPYADYEQVFQSIAPAGDGQFKAHVYPQETGTDLYIANAGRFNVDDHFGWPTLEDLLARSQHENVPILSHSQVQTLLGAIGTTKGFDVWVPTVDRGKLDWGVTRSFACCDLLPFGFDSVKNILGEIDVIWINRDSGRLSALFEVEHSTPVYSGLLRFNDIHLTVPTLRPRFSIVANDARRDVFATQVSRPTFKKSGLTEICSFLEYMNVFGWYKRVAKNEKEKTLDSGKS